MNRKLIFTRIHMVLEILGYVFLLAAFIVAIVACATGKELPWKFDAAGNITGYDSPGVLFMMPAALLFTNIILSLVMHFLPVNAWNVPFTIRPGREIAVYRDMTMMIVIMVLLFGIFSAASTFLLFRGLRTVAFTITWILVAALFADIIVMTALAAWHNRK